MDNEEVKNEEKMVKKDFHPLWIYLVFQIVVPIVLMFIIGAVKNMITGNEINVQEHIGVASIISMFGLFLVLFILYFSKIKTQTKKITKKDIIFILVSFVIVIGINLILSSLIKYLNVAMENQDYVSSLLSTYAIPSILISTILVPLAEEIVFRYSLGSLINNKVVFVIVSSLLFALFHGIGIATLLYFFLGVAFAIIYLKADKNFMVSYFVHVLNNIVGVLLILIAL